MKDIVIVQMPTQMPLRDASACADRTFGAAAALTDGYVVDDINPLFSIRGLGAEENRSTAARIVNSFSSRTAPANPA
jgi:hypothetical protein